MKNRKELKNAIEAYNEEATRIAKALGRLNNWSQRNIPDGSEHWGHVGDLADVRRKLEETTDRIFKEGEYKV